MKHPRAHLALLSLLLLPPATAAQTAQEAKEPKLDSGLPQPAEQSCFDVLRYELELAVDPEARTIAGTLALDARTLAPSESILLDLDARLKVARVTDGSAELAFQREDGRLRVQIGAPLQKVGGTWRVVVHYGGTPRVAPRAPWDGGFTWSKTPSGAHWIATTCQGEGADVWWPCKDQPDDEPDTMDIRVSVPEPLVCASNGRLQRVHSTKPGWRTYDWHVSTPINAYSVALNIAPYATIEGRMKSVAGDEFPVVYYVLPENKAKGEALFKEILADLAFFESVFGPYPFRADKYGVAETPHLGMEHQSITAYGNNYKGNPWGKDQGFDFLLHHEMAHEWWALLVTARNWNDFWIHEGLGTYAQSLYTERTKGPEAYRHVMGEQRRSISNRGAVAPREPRTSGEMYFAGTTKESPGGDIYYKGSWIVHTLRWLLGDEVFFRVLRRWAYPQPELEARTDGSACRFATTDELLAIAEQVSGRELDWFWELYLRQAQLPKLVDERKGDVLELRWETPGGLAFPLPVEVEAGGRVERVEMKDGQGRFELRGAETYTLDPKAWLLRDQPKAPRGR